MNHEYSYFYGISDEILIKCSHYHIYKKKFIFYFFKKIFLLVNKKNENELKYIIIIDSCFLRCF